MSRWLEDEVCVKFAMHGYDKSELNFEEDTSIFTIARKQTFMSALMLWQHRKGRGTDGMWLGRGAPDGGSYWTCPRAGKAFLPRSKRFFKRNSKDLIHVTRY